MRATCQRRRLPFQRLRDLLRWRPLHPLRPRFANNYAQVRGALPKQQSPSIYVTGFTPFDHTLEFECS
jgi:hypothetical protein